MQRFCHNCGKTRDMLKNEKKDDSGKMFIEYTCKTCKTIDVHYPKSILADKSAEIPTGETTGRAIPRQAEAGDQCVAP